MTLEASRIRNGLAAVGRGVRRRVHASLQVQGRERLTRPAAEGAGDLQYEIDVQAEDGLLDLVDEHLAFLGPLRVLSEGLDPAGLVLGRGEPCWRLVIDPIDGTRGLMHDKRSAFFLAALAPEERPTLANLEHAVSVEIPTSRGVWSDVMAVTRGQSVVAIAEQLFTGEAIAFIPQPSAADHLEHGFASIARFFGGAKAAIGAFEDALLARLTGNDPEALSRIFEDQYICNGGQFHALATGRDRFVADLRPLFRGPGGSRLLAAHPYDVTSFLIAQAAGAVITGADGRPLEAPLDLTTDVAFLAYASPALARRVGPAVLATLAEWGFPVSEST